MDIRIEGLSRRFGSVAALDRIDLHIARGELVALLGPSGSGKTTLLRAIAGLEPADEGRILFGALDAKVRKELRGWLRGLQRTTGYTTVFVTHDHEEALELADRVVILNRGRIEQLGPVAEVYECPANPFVFEFLGSANVLPAVARGRELWLPGAEHPLTGDQIFPGGEVAVYVRPGDVRLAGADPAAIPARVIDLQRTGPRVTAQAELSDGTRLFMELPHLHHDVSQLGVGAAVRLRLLQFRAYSRADAQRPGAGRPDSRQPAAALSGQGRIAAR